MPGGFCRGGACSPAGPHMWPRSRQVLRWCQAASTSDRRAWPLPVLVIDSYDCPEEYSVGTNPRNAPIVAPVNLVLPEIHHQPSPVSVEMPRGQPKSCPTAHVHLRARPQPAHTV
ncbi:MAG: hypothetical protein JWR85_3474 [Marmoricola sp.]|nr:hypothetical protein [Marmoricola sp.]